jgi:hypothetical protein
MSLTLEASRSDDSRQPIPLADLEAAITEVITKSARSCEGFVGVIIQRKVPDSPLDTNWELKGVRFGRADRANASQALAIVIESMQREFRLSTSD